MGNVILNALRLKKEGEWYSEMSAILYQIILSHIQENSVLHTHRLGSSDLTRSVFSPDC